MSQDSYPDAATGRTVSNTEDAPLSNELAYLTLNKNLELRIKTDDSLRTSIESLILELKDLKDILRIIHNL